jgi:hypothetical protein
MRPDICRVEGEAHCRAVALWWMKRLRGGARLDAGVDLTQTVPGAPHLNSHLPGQRGSSGQQPPFGPEEGPVVSEDGSTGVMPDVRLVHGYREAAVAGDLEETTQGVEFSNACRWMKHMSAHRAEQVGRQSGFSGSTPKQKPGRLRTAASNSITSMSAASYEQSVTTTRYRPGGPL